MVADAGGHKHPQLLLVAWQLKTVSVASASVNFARCAWVRLLPRMLLLTCFFSLGDVFKLGCSVSTVRDHLVL